MKVASGKVIGGKVIVEAGVFDDGADVTVIARDDDEQFTASHEQEAALLAAIAEVENGQTITGTALVERLRSFV